MDILSVILIAVGLDLIGKINPEVVYVLFAYPAAFLASLFLGSHLVFTQGQITIPLLNHSINVIPSCSGYGFFCLLYAMIATYIFRLSNKSKVILYSLVAIPIAYCLTIITNGCRIICAYQANEIAKFIFPSNFNAAIHQGVGIFLFLTVLMGISLVLERKFCHD